MGWFEVRKQYAIVLASIVAITVGFWAVRNTLVFRAASDGNTAALSFLLHVGANANAREAEGETPLMYAAVEGRSEAVLFLLRSGAEINAVSMNNETALGRAAAMGRTETVRILVEKGANIERGGNHGSTPLMYASSQGHLQIVRLLLKKGSQVNAQDEDGDTALAYAAIRDAPKDVLNELIAAHADVRHRNKRGKTAEELALENGHQEIAELIREAGRL